MLADHAARILAVAARLRPEARRVRGELDRQRFCCEDLIAHLVGQRNFRGRNEVQLLALTVAAALARGKHVLLELGQLPRAQQRLRVDDVRRVALGVAMLARVHVQHELRERTMQAGDCAAHHRKTRAAQLGGRGEIEPTCASQGSETGEYEQVK